MTQDETPEKVMTIDLHPDKTADSLAQQLDKYDAGYDHLAYDQIARELRKDARKLLILSKAMEDRADTIRRIWAQLPPED